MARGQDGIGQALSLPTDGGHHFSHVFNLTAWNFQQDAKVPSLAEAVVPFVKFLPLGGEEIDGSQTAPFGKTGTYHVTMSGVIPVRQPKYNGFVVDRAAPAFHRKHLFAKAEGSLSIGID